MRLAFITPRYGAEITHGAEHACRLLAEQLSHRHDVDVFTTCARNESTWKNEYAEGADRVRGVFVRRFATAGTGDREALRRLSMQLFRTPHARTEELEWVKRRGPSVPGLLEHLTRTHRQYDALVFFSVTHATTVQGLDIAPERSVLFPWLVVDPAVRLGVIQHALRAPAGVAYFSAAERPLYRVYAPGSRAHEETVGIGVEAPPHQEYPRLPEGPSEPGDDEEQEAPEPEEMPAHLSGRGAPFRRRHRLHGRFVLYGGRVESDNGCEELFEYFDAYAAQDGDSALVLMGVKLMKVPEEPWVRLAGVLPDRERLVAFAAADVTVAPDPNDLLAQSTVESFAVGTPVLASARNLAAVEHCRRGNAGLYYANREEFVEALRLLMTDARLRETLGRNGQEYARQHLRWDPIVARFERLVTKLKP